MLRTSRELAICRSDAHNNFTHILCVVSIYFQKTKKNYMVIFHCLFLTVEREAAALRENVVSGKLLRQILFIYIYTYFTVYSVLD